MTEIVAVPSGDGGNSLASIGNFAAGLGTLGLGTAAVIGLRRREADPAAAADGKPASGSSG